MNVDFLFNIRGWSDAVWLRTLAALAEDLGSHDSSQLPINLVPGALMPSSDCLRLLHMCGTYTYTGA